MRARSWILAVSCCLLAAPGRRAPAGEHGGIEIKPKRSGQSDAAGKDPLEKKLSFDFKKKPLAEAAAFVGKAAGLTVTCEEGLAKTLITLRMTKAPARLALKWIARLAGAETEFGEGGKVTITRNPKLKLVEKAYDVKNLERSLKPPPGWCGPVPKLTADSLGETIRRRIRPNTWGRNGRSIRVEGGKLVVVQTEEVHRAISALLGELRQKKAGESPEKKPKGKDVLEFVETPAGEAIEIIRRRAGANIVVDPACKELLKTPVTFRTTGMKIGQVLDWVLRLSRMQREFKDGAIYITPGGGARKADVRGAVLRILDAKDGPFREPARFKPPPPMKLPGGK